VPCTAHVPRVDTITGLHHLRSNAMRCVNNMGPHTSKYYGSSLITPKQHLIFRFHKKKIP